MKSILFGLIFLFNASLLAENTALDQKKVVLNGGAGFLPEKKKSKKDLKIDKKIEASKSKVFYRKTVDEKYPPKVEIILDGSGSMGQVLSSRKSKMYHSKELLKDYLSRQWKQKTLVGLRVYGAKKKGDCSDSELLVNFREKSLYEVENKIKKIGPLGMTPLSKSIRQAVDDLQGYPGPKKIVILTDGEDTCGGDPCETSKYLRKINDETTQFYTIGIGFQGGEYNLQNMKCLGPVLDAQSDSELSEGLSQIDEAIFGDSKNLEVRSPNPNAMVRVYKVGQSLKTPPVISFGASERVKLPPGEYKATVSLNPLFVFKKFLIRKKRRTILVVKGDATIGVNYTDKLLNVEVYDIHGKVVKEFKSNEKVKVPMGSYELKIFHNPFYEKKIPLFELYPGGKKIIDITNASSYKFKYKKLIGFYVYRNEGQLLGKYLTNAKGVIPKGKYIFHVDKKCPLDDVRFEGKDDFKVISCGMKKNNKKKN